MAQYAKRCPPNPRAVFRHDRSPIRHHFLRMSPHKSNRRRWGERYSRSDAKFTTTSALTEASTLVIPVPMHFDGRWFRTAAARSGSSTDITVATLEQPFRWHARPAGAAVRRVERRRHPVEDPVHPPLDVPQRVVGSNPVLNAEHVKQQGLVVRAAPTGRRPGPVCGLHPRAGVG